MLSRCSRVKAYNRANKRCLAYGSAIFRKGITETENFISTDTTPPLHARVVVCGGGVMGASVAYNLAKLGWGTHTVLIEQNRLVVISFNNKIVYFNNILLYLIVLSELVEELLGILLD